MDISNSNITKRTTHLILAIVFIIALIMIGFTTGSVAINSPTPYHYSQPYEIQTIDIINQYSTPEVGGTWIVLFNTTGTGLLQIDNFNPGEVSFNSMYYKDNNIDNQNNWVKLLSGMTDDSISTYWNYGEGKLISDVWSTGKHTIEFVFGNKAQAYNNAFTNQKTFELDLDNPVLSYEQNQLNDTAYSELFLFDLNNYVTFEISLPKTANVTSSTIDITGQIYPIIYYTGLEILAVVIDDIDPNYPGNEMILGLHNTVNNLRLISSTNILIWDMPATIPNYNRHDIITGDFTSDPGNEIITAEEGSGMMLYNNTGSLLWTFSPPGTGKSVAIGDIISDVGNEIVFGSADTDPSVYLINSSKDVVWTFSADSSINALEIADINQDTDMEIVVATYSGKIYVLNKTGSEIDNWTKDSNVWDIAIGDINEDFGYEIAVATQNSTLYILNSTLDELWNFTIHGDTQILSVDIGEFSDIYDGNEIIIGADNKYIYVLNSTGDIILEYLTDWVVSSVTHGIVISSNGTNIYDVVGSTSSGYLYVLNYDSFPTNVTIDINSDDKYDWNYTTGDGRLRSTEKLDDVNANISNNFNTYIDSTCATDLCNIPSKIYALNNESRGYLNLSSINISYDYNASNFIDYEIIDYWSRTDSISVNESIVSQGKNITFDNPTIRMIVRYIKINDTATICGFDEEYVNVTIKDYNYCDITSKTFDVDAQETISKVLWDNRMRFEIPITINESGVLKTYYTDNFDAIKNVTIRNEIIYSSSLFTAITANATIDDSDPEVHGDIKISVIWGQTEFDITPATACPTMDTSLALGFSACKNDTNDNGIYDFVKWIQPNITAGTSTRYIVKAALNLETNMTDANVTAESGIWGDLFNYSIYVNDSDGDSVNVTLWVTINDSWTDKGTITVNGEGLVEFNNIESTKEWVLAANSYKFEYFDFNSTGYKIHSKKNTSDYSGPVIVKHNVTVSSVFGNDSIVYRENDSTRIEVIFNDTTVGVPVNIDGISCAVYVSKDGINKTLYNMNNVNSTGYCSSNFDLNSNYSVGGQIWNVSIDSKYYNLLNTTNYTVNVKGNVSIGVVAPYSNESILRDTTITFSAQLTDEYNIDVTATTINTTNYTCTWYFNNTEIGSSSVNTNGLCTYNWNPDCSYITLGDYGVNVTINNIVPFNYTLDYNDDYDVRLTDNIAITIYTPSDNQQFYKGDEIKLNSSATDGCDTQEQNTYAINWYTVNKVIALNITEISSRNITDRPVIIKASDLESYDVNVSSWKINSTRLNYIDQDTEINVPIQIQNISIGQKYMNSYSEIVFLINMSANESQSYMLYLDEQNPNPYVEYKLSFIRNNDFSNNSTEYWTGDGTATYVGNISVLSISALSNTKNVSQTLFEPILSEYVKIRYRQSFRYQSEYANVSLIIGDYICDLNNFTELEDISWKTKICNDAQINGSTNINITIVDEGNGESTDIDIDYICISDINGTCINSIVSSDISVDYDTKTSAGSGNTTWTSFMNHSVGSQKIIAYATGPYYVLDKEYVNVNIFGFSQISDITVSSSSCSEDGLRCFLDSTVNITCNVSDANISTSIFNYSVGFYDNLTFLGTTNTNYDGIATYTWVDSTSIIGSHPIVCNISDVPDLYYNISQNWSDTVNVSFSDDKTSGQLRINSSYLSAKNITHDWNATLNISVLINNTGDFDMFNPTILFFEKTGFVTASNKCKSITPSGNCTTNIIINITQYATLGNNTLNFTLIWDNNNTDFSNESIVIDVLHTTYLKIIDVQIDSSEISYGDIKTLGNVTISAFGNTPLYNISLNTTGGNSSIINDWLNYSGNNFDIDFYDNLTITVNITVPENKSLMGNYWTYIIANDTESLCMGDYDFCSDMILINITIKDVDWKVVVEDYDVVAGKGGPTEIGKFKPVTIFNMLNHNFTFIINITGNGSSYITTNITINGTVSQIISEDNYTIPANFTGILDIYYNVSEASLGKHDINITITSNDTTLVPEFVNEVLSLDVSALSIDITYPTESLQAGPVNSSHNITIYVDAEYNYMKITDSNKINWSINVSGLPCLYEGATIFNFPYVGTTYDYELQCNAPLIDGNKINNTLKVTGYYAIDNSTMMIFTAEQANAVKYDDIMPPTINSITLNVSDSEGNIDWNDNINLINVLVNVTDNTGISQVLANVTYPDASVMPYSLTLVSDDIWTFDLITTNQIGDYKIDISANDSAHGLVSSTVNETTGYFDVYTDLEFSGVLKDTNDDFITGDFQLYKNGTDWAIHDFSVGVNGTYKWDIHKRIYDIKIYNLWDAKHSIKLRDVNISTIMQNQHNDSNATNVTDVFKLDLVTLNDSLDIGQITLPTTAPDAGQDPLLALGIYIPYINYTSAEITLNYTQGLLDIGHTISEDYLRIYKCSEWNMTTRSCATDFVKYGNVALDTKLNTITFNITSTSAYAIAEWCRGTTCGYIADPPSPSSSGGGSSPARSVCGNDVCETGENSVNCPIDCKSITEFFSVDSNIGNIFLTPGENKTYNLSIQNLLNTSQLVNISVLGEIIDYINFSKVTLELKASENRIVNLYVSAEDTAVPGTYYGTLIFDSINQTTRVPVALKITSTSSMLQEMDIKIQLITKKIRPYEDIKFNIIFSNLAKNKGFNVTLDYIVKNSKTEEIIKVVNETIFLTESITLRKTLSLADINTVGLGEYYLEVLATYGDTTITQKSSVDTFEVVLTFWETTMGNRVKWSIIILSLLVVGYYGRIRYIRYKHRNERYIQPVNYSLLPGKTNDSFCVGKISETDRKSYFNPKDLTTHLLVAGSTGSGKSVAASVIVEEALEHNIPVVVFDPTVQWTGFMKPCKDDFILNRYSQFGMDPRYRRSYKGVIEEVTDPNIQVDFKKYMNPGEITVFTLNKLKTGEYDIAIRSIIKTLFAQTWEESTELKMIIVLDEVHRLLEKYGGSGGYTEVEKACREFRKWGIGLIMISQVSSDFKEAISGNVLTEIQLNTKSLSDIEKWKNKYGLDFANRISRQGIGVGMIQNPKYNNGKPWFISFRPTWHSPHKILNEDLDKYKDFSEKLEKIESMIEGLKNKNINTGDFELELKLAKNKLKQGRFRIAEIYISSLMEHLKRYKP
ncbi:MAG: DUF87 domain-containing protein [DPANN group archaeon]|nr:DUF87 domain-containing protein [DPANN group archaeon]